MATTAAALIDAWNTSIRYDASQSEKITAGTMLAQLAKQLALSHRLTVATDQLIELSVDYLENGLRTTHSVFIRPTFHGPQVQVCGMNCDNDRKGKIRETVLYYITDDAQ